MTPFTTIPDAYGRQTDVLVPPPHRQAHPLVPAVAVTVPVPAGARNLLLAATTDVWVQYDGVAAVPTTAITHGTAPEFNPVARDVSRFTTISVVAEKAGLVSLGFYG